MFARCIKYLLRTHCTWFYKVYKKRPSVKKCGC
jgi:hypothetical protein